MRQEIISELVTTRPRVVQKGLPLANGVPEPARRDLTLPFIVWLTVGGICFGASLVAWAKYGWKSELYSYTLMIPLISLYLAWAKARPILLRRGKMRWALMLPFVVGFGALGSHLWLVSVGSPMTLNDRVALELFAFFCFVTGGSFMFLSVETLRRAGFALAFLIFMLPLPDNFRAWLESTLQHGSADVAEFLFSLAGTPLLRHSTVLQLPGFTLEVAPECSGIHSTLVLFITSLVAAYLFLQSPWRRVLLSLAVVPLALLRNGFRIFTIGQLCVNVSPDMINSYIHRKGGPIFFALSLVPLFLLLLLLWRTERKGWPASSRRDGHR